MASLLVVIFVVELAVAVVNSIGAATINNLVRPPKPQPRRGPDLLRPGRARDLFFVPWLTCDLLLPKLWNLYIATPLGTSKQIRDQRELQQSYLKVRHDLNATSSQDEFAKWAKLRRQHDKMLEELEKMSASAPASLFRTSRSPRWAHIRELSPVPGPV